MKKAIYARSAIKDSKAIKSQIDRIKKAYKIGKCIEYVDDGGSGMSVDRSGLKKMLADAKDGVFDTLYITDIERLSRSSCQVLKIIKDLGQKVKIVIRNNNHLII